MRLWLYRLLRAAPLLAFVLTVCWVWQTTPFAQPLVERSTAELRLALDRALARKVDEDWVNTTLAEALGNDELDRAQMVLEIAASQRPPLTPDHDLVVLVRRMAEAAEDRATQDCLRCMVEAGTCNSLTHVGMCLVPFELTPAGDVNALRREAQAWVQGEEIDELNVGLAVVGLGATATVLVTGGSSATAKAGATALRVARRIGAVSPRFLADLTDMARLDIRAGALFRHVFAKGPLDEALDTARLARLGDLATDLTRVADNTSIPETLLLLRHVDDAGDVSRLARVSDAAGHDTRKYFEVLGSRRVFAKLVRLSDVAMTAAALLYALGLQVAVMVANGLGRLGLRGLTRLLKPA